MGMLLDVVADSNLPITWQLVGVVCSVALGTTIIVSYLNNQFKGVGRMIEGIKLIVYRLISKHNREDDERFEALNQNIFDIHLHLAQRDGTEMPRMRTFPRRRYMVESVESDQDEQDEATAQKTN